MISPYHLCHSWTVSEIGVWLLDKSMTRPTRCCYRPMSTAVDFVFCQRKVKCFPWFVLSNWVYFLDQPPLDPSSRMHNHCLFSVICIIFCDPPPVSLLPTLPSHPFRPRSFSLLPLHQPLHIAFFSFSPLFATLLYRLASFHFIDCVHRVHLGLPASSTAEPRTRALWKGARVTKYPIDQNSGAHAGYTRNQTAHLPKLGCTHRRALNTRDRILATRIRQGGSRVPRFLCW